MTEPLFNYRPKSSAAFRGKGLGLQRQRIR